MKTKTGNLNALLDRMVELAKVEDALNGINDNLGSVASGLINLARDAGLSEDQIIDALSGNNPKPQKRLAGRAYSVNAEGRTVDTYTGEEVEV